VPRTGACGGAAPRARGRARTRCRGCCAGARSAARRRWAAPACSSSARARGCPAASCACGLALAKGRRNLQQQTSWPGICVSPCRAVPGSAGQCRAASSHSRQLATGSAMLALVEPSAAADWKADSALTVQDPKATGKHGARPRRARAPVLLDVRHALHGRVQLLAPRRQPRRLRVAQPRPPQRLPPTSRPITHAPRPRCQRNSA